MENNIVLRDAGIFDCESGVFIRRDVKITDGKIAAVLPSQSVNEGHALDMNGRILLKPFCDYHLHIPGAELYNLFGVNLSASISVSEYAEKIRAGASLPGDIVRGFGWNMGLLNSFFKSGEYLAFLDEVCPNKAVFLFSNDFHSCWCNSKAVALIHSLNIGYVSADDAGTACIFHEHIAKNIFEEPTLSFSDAEIKQAVLSYQKKLLDYGIGEVYTFMFIGAPRSAVLRALVDLDRSSQLRLNIKCCYDIYPGQTKDEVLAHIAESRAYESRRIHFHFAKIYVDGVIDNHSAWLKEPYADKNTKGYCLWPLDELKEMAKFLHSKGIPIHAHAIGDLASETLAEFIKNAKKIPDGDVIAHLQLGSDVCVEDMAKNGIFACFQPFWFGDGLIEGGIDRQRLGGRALDEYPIRKMIAAGVNILFSSDNPVTENFAPLIGICCACEKMGTEHPDTFKLALNAYTIGAYDGKDCQIEVGDLADFVCLYAKSKDELLAGVIGFEWMYL